MRKSSQRKAASITLNDSPSPSASGWRKDAIAAVVAVAALSAVVANAAFMQTGPHPAPIFAGQPGSAAAPSSRAVRVVGQEITGPPLAVTAAPKGPLLESGTVRAEPMSAEPAKAEPAAARPRQEVIADIQRELSRRGFYDGAPDGVHGPKTDAAMRDFEQAAGLRPGSEANEIFLRAVMRSQAKAGSRVAAAQPAGTDPIAELIAPSSKRIFALQRALTDFGYGQFKPNGIFGPETRLAIEQFERTRKMPPTGQISPRLLRELSAVTGRQFE
ncbi:peptidoglycan-binding domain-containing protein [Pseudorhodoplanes sp.]|uniref:peptidoglycan-binding domain-containing protein n=1 Tax=Pseudorhodoplanes sp. TaxID=1934341 RepID=UPI003D10F055